MSWRRVRDTSREVVDTFAFGEGEDADGWDDLEPGLAVNAVIYGGRQMPFKRKGVTVLPAEPRWMFATGSNGHRNTLKHVPVDGVIAWVDGRPVDMALLFRCGVVAHYHIANADHLPDEQLCEACLPLDPVVYRYFDAEGDLLYVGCTTRPRLRMKEHETAGWWPLARSLTTEFFDSHKAALAAEAEAICTEAPLFNRTHTRLRVVA